MLTLSPDRSRSPRRVTLLIVAYVAVLGLLAWAALGEDGAAPNAAACIAAGGCVNLDTATAAELDTLYRVGPVLAERIIDARPEGGYASLHDLTQVRGIGLTMVCYMQRVATFGSAPTTRTERYAPEDDLKAHCQRWAAQGGDDCGNDDNDEGGCVAFCLDC